MKKIIVSLILVIVTVFSLASCSIDLGGVLGNLGFGNSSGGNGDNNNGNNNGGSGGNSNSNSNAIYGDGVSTAIVTPSGKDIGVSSISGALFATTNIVPDLKTDTDEKVGAEIVIGDTTRQISASAKEALDRRIRKEIREAVDQDLATKNTVGFAVYGSGNSVALVWSNEEIKDYAIEYFNTEFLDNSTLSLTEGYTHTQVFSITTYREENETVMKEAAWAKLKSDFIAAGCTEAEAVAAVEATRNHYTAIFDEKIYIWLANLYDPEIGGFYYSTSARNTVGFLPDIESTFQAVNYICNTGFLDDFAGLNSEKVDYLPEDMQEQILNFLLNLQSPEDGYFYHPQWENVEVARYSRDLTWATELIGWLDSQPLYDTPNGVPGSLGAPTGSVTPSSIHTLKLNSSNAISAAARVVAANSSVYPEHLQSLQAFNAYLDTFDLENDSYQWGHIITSQSGQIIQRGPEYVQAFKEHFDAAQRSDNGLWEERVGYDSINGLMKIMTAYESFDIKFNYAEQALQSALSVALLENEDALGKVPNHAVDVYNVFYAIKDICNNVERHGDDPTLASEFRRSVISQSANIISMATIKAAKFRQPEGSYAYNHWGANETSQGVPVCVPGLAEGDVNGNTIATNGIIGDLYGMLGIDRPRIYYYSDYVRFIEEIESLSPVIKNTAIVEAEVVTFDDDPLGSTEPLGLNVCKAGVGKTEVVVRPGQTNSNNHALLFTDESNTGNSNSDLQVLPGGIVYGQTRNVLEFEIYMESDIPGSPTYQCWMGYSFMFVMTVRDERVYIADISNNSGAGIVYNELDVSFPIREWHKLRFEYYHGTRETVKTKIFLDGNLRAISTNYYGNQEGMENAPSINYERARIYSLVGTEATAYFDNIYADKDNVKYTEEPIFNPNRVKDFENGEIGSEVLPNDVTSNYNGDPNNGKISVAADPEPEEGNEGNKVLHYNSDGGDYVYFPVTVSDSQAKNCFVFDFDIYINGASKGDNITQISFYAESGVIMCYHSRCLLKRTEPITSAF